MDISHHVIPYVYDRMARFAYLGRYCNQRACTGSWRPNTESQSCRSSQLCAMKIGDIWHWICIVSSPAFLYEEFKKQRWIFGNRGYWVFIDSSSLCRFPKNHVMALNDGLQDILHIIPMYDEDELAQTHFRGPTFGVDQRWDSRSFYPRTFLGSVQ